MPTTLTPARTTPHTSRGAPCARTSSAKSSRDPRFAPKATCSRATTRSSVPTAAPTASKPAQQTPPATSWSPPRHATATASTPWSCTAMTSNLTPPRCWIGRSRNSNGELSRERAHRVPWGQQLWLLLESRLQLGGKIRAPRGDLEHVLVEPRVVHREKALLPWLRAPRVLHSPAARRAVEHVHTREQHGVRHPRLAVLEPRRLVHSVEPGAVDRAQVVQIPIHKPEIAPHLLAHVTAEPDRLAILEHAPRNVLHQRHLDVQIHHLAAAHHIAPVLHRDRKSVRIGRTRIVHQAHVVVQRQVD